MNIKNKIEADDRNLRDVLNEKKYTVDYFQREYRWEKKQMDELIADLTLAFTTEYQPGHTREQGKNYNNYYLGSFVINEKDGKRSIIDGQQRLTSLTLFLIFLNNLQKELGYNEAIEPMVFSKNRGKKDYNLTVEERRNCLEALFEKGSYTPSEFDDESTCNMSERYQDIEDAFPEELKNDAFPHFIDWLKEHIIMVEIIAYSDDNAYAIFETTNDRGLNSTSSEMLKGFILSNFKDLTKRQKADDTWKKKMKELKSVNDNKDEEHRFFQSWLRSQYADTIRLSKEGSENKDFETIGTRFHSWVRDNQDKMNINSDDGATFERLFYSEFQFYFEAYIMILNAEKMFNQNLEHVFYINRWGIAPTLSYPLMLAPLIVEDGNDVMLEKINTVARYIEIFAVRRSINFRKFSSSSIRHTMCALVKEIRGKNIDELKKLLSNNLQKMKQDLKGVETFRLHGQNKRFVKFLLSRITAWIEEQSGKDVDFSAYYEPKKGKQIEVEHIWADKFREHGHDEEFEQEQEFKQYRNRLGGLVLLPRGTNQSLGDMPYEEKLRHYIGENLLVSSLCSGTYERNPNFRKLRDGELKLPFEPHSSFKKADIDTRQKLYRAICEHIWPQDL